MRRAKALRCEHGSIPVVHIYEVGNPKSEVDAINWVTFEMPSGYALVDVDIEEARPHLMVPCPCSGLPQPELEFAE